MNPKKIKIIILSILGVATVVMLFLAAFQFFKPDRNTPDATKSEDSAMRIVDDPESSLYVSEDGGGTWHGIPGAEFSVSRLLFDTASSRLLIGTNGRGIWEAGDSRFSSVERAGGTDGIFAAGNEIILDIARAANTTRAYIAARNSERSFLVSGEGATWQESFFEPLKDNPVRAVELDPFNSIRVLLGSGTGFYISEDGGETWRVVYRFRRDILQLIAHPRIPGRYFVTTESGNVFRTSDYGVTWEERTKEISKYRGSRDNQSLYIGPASGIVYITSDHGLLVSYDAGDTWNDIPLIVPPDSLPVTGFAAHPTDTSILYIAASSQLYKSQDGGKTWKGMRFVDKDVITAIAIYPVNPNIVMLGFGKTRRSLF